MWKLRIQAPNLVWEAAQGRQNVQIVWGYKVLRLIIILACGVFLWDGFDQVGVTMFNNEIKNFTIEEVENGGVGDARYIEVTDTFPAGIMVYTEDQDTGHVSDVVFPVTTLEKVVLATEDDPAQATLYILRDLDKMGEQSCTYDNDFCIAFELQTYKGIVQVGLNDMDDETRDLFVDNGLELPENVVVLAENKEPAAISESLMTMGLALLILLIALWSFTWGKGKGKGEDEAETEA